MHQQFEFRHHGAEAQSPEATVEFRRYSSDQGAKSYAGRLAIKIGGPVDIALAGGADWNDRYITTAAPSDVNVTGFRFERVS